MKRIILKELREHFKVALLALAVLAVMLVLAFNNSTAQSMRASISQGYNASEGLQPLLSESILTQVVFFCAIFGVLLGWMQIHAERHPDLWAFLVHRPIPRTTIFRAKVLSGLLLYIVGTGLPLLGLVIVVSIPGKVAAPFAWAMALPLLAIFLAGMIFYLAGLLTGLRKARWFASRGFGLGLAVMAGIGVRTVGEFWQALLIVVVGGAILALAVWGSFLTGGHYRAQPILGKIALTLSSVVSVAVLIGLLAGLVGNLAIQRGSYTYSQFQMLKDGSIVKITQHGLGGAFEDADITDLNGRPLLDEKTGQPIKLKELQKRYPLGLSAGVHFNDGPQKRYRDGYSYAGRFFSSWRTFNKTIWYLTADGRLVAYHGMTRRMIGTLAPSGGKANGLPDDTRFLRPNDYSWNSLRDYTKPEVLASARTAYLIDLENRELKPLLTVTNGDVIGGYSGGAWVMDSPTILMQDFALILTRASIQVVDGTGFVFLKLPYQPSHPAYPVVSVHWLQPANTYAVRFEPDYVLNLKSGGKLLSHVKWINADGSVRNTLDLPKLEGPHRNDFLERLLIPLLPPAFPIFTWEEPYRVWQVLRLVPAILCALVSWWLARRNSFSIKANVGWAIFTFLFGLPGLLAFLAVQEWPAKERCPRCQKLRAVNREHCEHCGAEFSPPEKTGIEIFEPLETK